MLDNPRTQNTPHFSSGPEPPPRQGAKARFFALVKSLAGGGLAIMLMVAAAEFLFAPQFKPSHMIGVFGGNVEKSEIEAKQQAAVEFARLQAEAAAKAQADAAKRAEILANTEGVKSFAAQAADAFCLFGQFLGTAKNPDTRSTGQSLQQACGAGDRIRNGMAQDLTGQGAAGAASPPPAPPPQREAALPKAAPYKIIKVVPQDLSAFRPY